MRTRNWWGSKRPLHVHVFDTVGDSESGYQIICPHGEGAITTKPGKHYCLSLDGSPFLQDIGFGALMHDTPPIAWLKYERRRVSLGND